MTPPHRPKLLIAERVTADLRQRARMALPNETGGILLGVRTAGRPWIVRALEIPTPDRGLRHYRLPADTTTPAVRDARRVDPRLGYLGEWHSHPANVGPSQTDRATMRRLSLRSPRTGLILIIVKDCVDDQWLDAYETSFPFLRRRKAVATGDLPPRMSG